MSIGAIIFRQNLLKYYEGSGFSTDSVIKYLMDLNSFSGYDVSYDESLYVFHYDSFLVIVGVGGLQFINKVNYGV